MQAMSRINATGQFTVRSITSDPRAPHACRTVCQQTPERAVEVDDDMRVKYRNSQIWGTAERYSEQITR